MCICVQIYFVYVCTCHEQVAKGGRAPAAAGFSFDHDDMMGASKRITAHDLNGMIADAKNLDSRFSRSVTKNFM